MPATGADTLIQLIFAELLINVVLCLSFEYDVTIRIFPRKLNARSSRKCHDLRSPIQSTLI